MYFLGTNASAEQAGIMCKSQPLYHLTLLQCLPIPIKKLSGLMSLCMNDLQ